jgi:hypothetical protein
MVTVQPFDAISPEDSTPWRRNGRGLTADVINALDDKWYPFFYEAILDWDNGYPDSLTLSTSTDVPDAACTMIPGKIKVCNGDYGKTSWKVRTGHCCSVWHAACDLEIHHA